MHIRKLRKAMQIHQLQASLHFPPDNECQKEGWLQAKDENCPLSRR